MNSKFRNYRKDLPTGRLLIYYDYYDEDYGDFGDDYIDLPEPRPIQRTLTDPVMRL